MTSARSEVAHYLLDKLWADLFFLSVPSDAAVSTTRTLLGVYNVILFLVLIAEVATGAVILESMGHLKELEGKIPHSGAAVKEFERSVNTLVNETYQTCCNVNATK